MNFSAFCRILVRFGPATQKFMLVKKDDFCLIRKKSPYHAKYLGISWTDYYYFYRFGRHMGWDDYPDIRLAIIPGMLLWQPVKFGFVRRRRQEQPLIFALAFDNGYDIREAAFKRLSGNNPATSCTNLVNFHPVMLEFTPLKRAIFAAIRSQFNDDLQFICHVGVPKLIGRLQF